MYSINTEHNKKLYLSLHYNGASSYLFVNGTDIHKFIHNLCLGNVSKDLSASNMKKSGFNDDIYDFSVDYDAVNVDDILDFHKPLLKKNDMVSAHKNCFLQD